MIMKQQYYIYKLLNNNNNFKQIPKAPSNILSLLFSSSFSSSPSHKIKPETTTALLRLLHNCKYFTHLKQIHSRMLVTGSVLNELSLSRLIAFCALSEPRNLDYCLKILFSSPHTNSFCWNVTIRGFVESEKLEQTIFLYKVMLRNDGLRPDKYTYPLLFKACSSLELNYLAHQILAHVLQTGFDSDIYVRNSLIQMLVLRGDLQTARKVFDESLVRDVVSWNSLINGCVRCGRGMEAIRIYDEMEVERVKPDEVTMIGVVSACTQLNDLSRGREFHRYIVENGLHMKVSLANALTDMYAKCGDIEAARKMFDDIEKKSIVSWTTMVGGYAKSGLLDTAGRLIKEMPEKDAAPWNAIISGCVQAKHTREALDLFHEMLANNVKPDEVTMILCLSACARLGAFDFGVWIHRYIQKQNLVLTVALGTALVDMYSKCGDISRALQIFHEMSRRNSLTWTAVIGGLALHGHANDAISYFVEMTNSELMPDEITFLGVLSACCHGGLVDDGRTYFAQMSTKYNLSPQPKHYSCMVNLLGRAGLLEEAEDLIKSMQTEPDAVVWGALFFACRMHGNVEMGQRVALKLLELDPDDSGIYVLLANMYEEANMWEEARRVRMMMNNRGVEKTPGCTSIEVNGTVAEFIVRDKSHPQSGKIYECLAQLMTQVMLTTSILSEPTFRDDPLWL